MESQKEIHSPYIEDVNWVIRKVNIYARDKYGIKHLSQDKIDEWEAVIDKEIAILVLRFKRNADHYHKEGIFNYAKSSDNITKDETFDKFVKEIEDLSEKYNCTLDEGVYLFKWDRMRKDVFKYFGLTPKNEDLETKLVFIKEGKLKIKVGLKMELENENSFTYRDYLESKFLIADITSKQMNNNKTTYDDILNGVIRRVTSYARNKYDSNYLSQDEIDEWETVINEEVAQTMPAVKDDIISEFDKFYKDVGIDGIFKFQKFIRDFAYKKNFTNKEFWDKFIKRIEDLSDKYGCTLDEAYFLDYENNLKRDTFKYFGLTPKNDDLGTKLITIKEGLKDEE